ncbi:unnamed protein product [Symbiodinium natans]|uniref:C3H1-type domain-containing protein n=1 Tax=Symbiodinium natans TaxID=878477 RepID=A0A812NUV9_9DINO|nr:unnamed protein product [Symbiodinium natans]
MTKAEQKKAVQFTRMCKFWRTNECKMGTGCTFAHDTAELRPSPKPCFEFSKSGSCVRGQACRFVHVMDSMKSSGKSSGLRISVQQASPRQHLLPSASTWPMAFAPYAPACLSTPMPELGHLLPPQPSVVPSCFRPPPGLEDVARRRTPNLTVAPETLDGDSRRSSLSDLSLGLDCALPIPKAVDLEQKWAADDATVATQSLTSTMCLSTTPTSFSDSDGSDGTSFWL